MYGKAFAMMYEGSLYGKGVVVFAVWNYVIAKMEPIKDLKRMEVRLNEEQIAATLGGVTAEKVKEAIEFLCSPDPRSNSVEEDGRRLKRLGEFTYIVVNGWKYSLIKNREALRAANAEAQARRREKKRLEALEKNRRLGKRVNGIPEAPPVETVIDRV